MQDVDLKNIAARLISELITLSGHTPDKDGVAFYLEKLEPYGFENVVKMLRDFLPEQSPEYPMPSIRELKRRMDGGAILNIDDAKL